MALSHTVSSFDEELKFLVRRISEMGGIAERMVADSVTALIERRPRAGAESDLRRCACSTRPSARSTSAPIVIIAKRQPMASDLREIIGSIRIASDLERVGDLGKNIAKRVIAVQR